MKDPGEQQINKFIKPYFHPRALLRSIHTFFYVACVCGHASMYSFFDHVNQQWLGDKHGSRLWKPGSQACGPNSCTHREPFKREDPEGARQTSIYKEDLHQPLLRGRQKAVTGCIPGEHSSIPPPGAFKCLQNQFSVIQHIATSDQVLESPVGSDSSLSLPGVASAVTGRGGDSSQISKCRSEPSLLLGAQG